VASDGRGILGGDSEIRARTKADMVRELVETAIMSGRLKAGERVIVDEIARETGVSKIPVREALTNLASAGLLEQNPNLGFRVTPLSLTEMEGVYRLRAEVEGLAAELAAPGITQSTLERLRVINRRMSDRVAARRTEGLSEENRKFHLIIAEATGFQVIAEVTDELLRKVHRYRSVVVRSTDSWADTVTEHENIIDALVTGDPDLARAVARRHASHQLEVETRAELA